MGKKHDSQYANFGWLPIDKTALRSVLYGRIEDIIEIQ